MRVLHGWELSGVDTTGDILSMLYAHGFAKKDKKYRFKITVKHKTDGRMNLEEVVEDGGPKIEEVIKPKSVVLKKDQ
jgi:hypothetical protein